MLLVHALHWYMHKPCSQITVHHKANHTAVRPSNLISPPFGHLADAMHTKAGNTTGRKQHLELLTVHKFCHSQHDT
jgi:hypothetical protein